MKGRFFRPLMIGAALTISGAASAQSTSTPAPASQTPPGEPAPIVVNGSNTLDVEIRNFVNTLAPAPARGQIARFEQRVCPAAVGLAPSQRRAVVSRMRTVAAAAGIQVGGADCEPNVLLVVTPNKRTFLETLRLRNPLYFGNMTPPQITRLIETPGPAVAWQLEGIPLTAQGNPIHIDLSTGLWMNRTTEPATRLRAPTRPQFEGAVVVVERSSLTGLTAVQLADYASIRAFAAVNPTRLARTSAPTILSILEAPMGSEIPVTMTRWDFGFLRGLYGSQANLYSGAQRSQIQESLTEELERPVQE